MNRHRRRAAPSHPAVRTLIAALVLLALSAIPAAASQSIAGTWAFSGGQILIEPTGAETFQGTVVTETRFDECVHPVGQKIWTDIAPHGDGSYWGLHQWYLQESNCHENPILGRTAFRLIEEADGRRYLRVCLSEPGGPQPLIAPDGSYLDTSWGCVNSALTEAPSKGGVQSFKESVSLPSGSKCLSLRSFKIHVQDPRYDAFKTISIRIGSRSIRSVRRRNTIIAVISLKGLPKGTFTIRIAALTYKGRHLSGSRTYHTCRLKPIHKTVSTKLT